MRESKKGIFGRRPERRRGEETRTWKDYQAGINYHNKLGIFDDVNAAYRFYNGDQWAGVQAGGEDLPVYNIIKPIVKYKVAIVAQNAMQIVYRPQDVTGEAYERLDKTCDALNIKAAVAWERMKLERKMWDDVRNGAITGDHYRYFYVNPAEKPEKQVGDTTVDDVEILTEEIDKTNIFFGDEQQTDIQKQPYIIISRRLPVRQVIREAKALGADEGMLDDITADTDTIHQPGDDAVHEVNQGDDHYGKVTSLVRFEKREDGIYVSRACRWVEYQEPTKIDGMTLYPIAAFVWSPVKGSARGVGEVCPIIPNQIEINKGYYRRVQHAKNGTYPRLVYTDALENPDDLDNVGAPLHIEGVNAQEIHRVIDYLNPPAMSNEAAALVEESISLTRELAGAGEVATGEINPEQASGTAIMAVRQSAALPISDSVAAYKQYVEDIALILYDLWQAYAPAGLPVYIGKEQAALLPPGEEYSLPAQVVIPRSELNEMRISVRIDTSPTNPYDKYAQEQSLENLLKAKYITFEEYVNSLSPDSVMPAGKLKKILDDRKRAAEEQQDAAANSQAVGNMPENGGEMPLPMPENGGGAGGEMPLPMPLPQGEGAGADTAMIPAMPVE